jgi:hypothetical protein
LSPKPDWEYKAVRPYGGRYWAYSKSNLSEFARQGILIHRKTGMPRLMQFSEEMQGVPLQDLWDDIPPASGKEYLGYQTQKPRALLERIINASCPDEGIVLDPFCGCGTAVDAAQTLGRRWIGIDITPLATNLIRDRLENRFPALDVPIEGWPADMAGAVALAAQTDKYLFQDWAVFECGARPAGGERKKGADRGIDGVMPFLDRTTPKRGIVSVKAGATGPTHVRDLGGAVASDDTAAFGVFICLYPPTKPMIEAALSLGTWTSEYDGQTYPRVQILSAQDLLDGKRPRMPDAARTPLFARPARERRAEGRQARLT